MKPFTKFLILILFILLFSSFSLYFLSTSQLQITNLAQQEQRHQKHLENIVQSQSKGIGVSSELGKGDKQVEHNHGKVEVGSGEAGSAADSKLPTNSKEDPSASPSISKSVSTSVSASTASILHRWPREQNLTFLILGENIFYFVAEMILEALVELNFTARHIMQSEVDLEDTQSIYIQTWSFYTPFSKKNRYIIYNWEQLKPANFFMHHLDLLPYFTNALELWDYSLANVDHLATYNLDSKLLVPTLSKASHNTTLALLQDKQTLMDRKLQMSFSGTPNPRRQELLAEINSALKTRPNPILASVGDFSELPQYRLLLNIHTNPIESGAVMEVNRLIQVLPLKVFVISERSADPFLDKLFAPCISLVDSMEEAAREVDRVLGLSGEDYVREVEKRYAYFTQNLSSLAHQIKLSNSWIWLPGKVSLPSSS